jgi:hypothetical protein
MTLALMLAFEMSRTANDKRPAENPAGRCLNTA